MAAIELADGCVERCPACAHRALGASESSARKEDWLRNALAPWREQLAPIMTVSESARWGYRDKLCLTAVWGDSGWRFGMIARGELIAIPRCPIHSQRARLALHLLAATLPPSSIFPLSFYVQAGAQATLVLKSARLPSIDWLHDALGRDLSAVGIEGLWLHLYPSAGRKIFAKNGWHLLYGQPRSVDASGLVYGPTAFQQLLPSLYQRSLDEAEAFLAPVVDDVVIDLYCGLGATLVRWIERGACVFGIELSGEAVACARENAPNAQVLRGACRARIPQLDDWLDSNRGGSRLLYVNPPRTGLEPEILNWIITSYRPLRIAYLSCSAGTLRRDLTVLDRAGYRVERITPYDFFPQTYHVETLALLQ